MDAWFRGERNEAYLFLGLGAVSAGTGAYLFTRDEPFARGAAYTAVGLGALELTFATTYLLSLGPLKSRLESDLARDRASFLRDERDRMERISERFVIYRWAELGVLATGVGLATWGFTRDHQQWAGVGVTAATHATLLLVLDLFAESRTHRYLRGLEGAPESASAPLRRELRLDVGLAQGVW